MPDEECQTILQELSGRGYEGVYFVSSDTFYIEMLPVGASKGDAIRKLCKLKNIPIDHTIAIGDYYNDAELLESGGIRRHGGGTSRRSKPCATWWWAPAWTELSPI